MSTLRQYKAITLIESILYLGIFGIMFFAVMQYVFNVSDSNRRATQTNEFERSTLFLNQHLTDSFDRAISIDPTGTTFDSSNGVLRLNITGGYLQYEISDSRIQFDDNGSTNYLTSGVYTVDEFTLERVENTAGGLTGVRVTLTMTSITEIDLGKTYVTAYIIE